MQRSDQGRVGVIVTVIFTIARAAIVWRQPVTHSTPAYLSTFGQVPIRGEKLPTATDRASSPPTQQGYALALSGRLFLTNAHVVANQRLQYSVQLPSGEAREIINFRLHPTKDLALIAAATGADRSAQPPTPLIDQAVTGKQRVTYWSGKTKNTCTWQATTIETQLVGLTDCQFSPGMSGTPLYTASGTLIGLITATSATGGFATPLSYETLTDWIDHLPVD